MGEDHIGQIVKIAFTSLAVIALAFTVALVQSAPLYLVGLTPSVSNIVRQVYFAHPLIALRVIYQLADYEHTINKLISVPLSKDGGFGRLTSAPRNSY